MITNEQLELIEKRARKALHGDKQNDFTYVASVCEVVPLLVTEVERLRKALSNIEQTTESNAYHGITAEATMRNRAHKALHGVEPEEVSPNE